MQLLPWAVAAACAYPERDGSPCDVDDSFSFFSLPHSGPGHWSSGWHWRPMLLCTPEQGKHTVEEKLQVFRSPSAMLVCCTACTGFQNVCFNSFGSRMLLMWLFPAELVLRSSPGSRRRSAELELGEPGRPHPGPMTPSSPALPCSKETGWANLLYLIYS